MKEGFSGSPMTPRGWKISAGLAPSVLAAALATDVTVAHTRLAVKALALPPLMTTARAVPPASAFTHHRRVRSATSTG